MAWTDPANRSTGDLITAAIWNTDVIDNLIYLHDRYGVIWETPANPSDTTTGDFATISLGNGASQRVTFTVPDDFEAAVSCEVLVMDPTGGTLTYAVDTDYSNPDSNEVYNFHSGGASGLTVSLTANVPKLISVLSYLSSMAAGDWVGVKLTSTTSPSTALRFFGLRLIYARV